MNEPKRGDIAYCGKGFLGLITSDTKKEVTYFDGSKAMAWTGIHLTNNPSIGSPWSAKNPEIVSNIEDVIDELL